MANGKTTSGKWTHKGQDLPEMSEDEARAQLLESNPQGRFVSPKEVAETAAWLVGPNTDAITGQAIVVAGGEVM